MMKNQLFGIIILIIGEFCVRDVRAQALPRPTAVQMEWQQMETTAFIHFNINTYTDMEWGYGNESPALFNPSKLDCRQWARTCKEAGMKGVILTAKHHDGFCLWPSAYTEHSVKNSPWKGGKGDLVREFVDACREYGLKVGLYLSPWDCNHPDYGKPEYITYFRNQLRELLTNYGELYEFWFDGANGGRGYYGTDSLHTRKISADYYPWEELTRMVYELQPNCVVHGGDLANIRWVGNEEGYALEEHWSTVRRPELYDKNVKKNLQWMRGHADGTIWMPSEVDVSVRPGWYYHASEDHKLKSLSRLTDIYYESVGRNSLLLLNLTPNQEGVIPREDSLRLVEWRKQVSDELSHGLLTEKMRVRGEKKSDLRYLMDNNRKTYWQAETVSPVIEVDFGKELAFNRLLLQEFVEEGQRVKKFSVSYFSGGQWFPLVQQTTIGYKRLLRFPEVKASRLRVQILDAWAVPCLSELQVFCAKTPLDAPTISRNKDGLLRLSADQNAVIYYTLNGQEPCPENAFRYQSPVMADGHVQIKAIAVDGDRQSGVSTRIYNGSKVNWSTKPDRAASLIFDENEKTVWMGKENALEVDLGMVTEVAGVTYLPDQSRWASGIAVKYVIEISTDGQRWSEAAHGDFANIQNHPVEQLVRFSNPLKARYIRFRAVSTVSGQKGLGVAEFNVSSF